MSIRSGVVLGLAALLLAVAAAGLSSAAAGDRAAFASKGALAQASGFKQCGNIPSRFLWGIRGRSVGCGKARKVAKKWLNEGQRQSFPSVIRFKAWRCTSKDYADGVNVKCKRRRHDQVRFAAGG